ncbi:hypothetical protein GCM10023178_10410 [Actinomadura luteofluorescens]
MRDEVTRLVTAEDHDREFRLILDTPDELAKLLDGVRIHQVHRTIVESHPPVGSGHLTYVELFCGTHETLLVDFPQRRSVGVRIAE